MTDQTLSEELLDFFKALSEQNRLKIIGVLAQNPCTVEKLAEILGLSVSTTSHHLSMLAHIGLVSARADGHYYIYSLQTEKLKEMAQHLLHDEELTHLSQPASEDAFERKVMAAFTRSDGRITSFPAQEKKYLVLLRYVKKAFQPGVRYTEKQVNEILSRYNDDTAMLRRSMVEYHFMERQGGGGEYWLADSEQKAPDADL
jgi:predicted transcriptional regulator